MSVVLDSSAILAWLQQEPGGGQVRALLDGAVVGAANWSEILQKSEQHGAVSHDVGRLLRALGVAVVPVEERDAEHAARLWARCPSLSLGDRLGLALADRLRVTAVTADAAWADAEAGVEVRLLRAG